MLLQELPPHMIETFKYRALQDCNQEFRSDLPEKEIKIFKRTCEILCYLRNDPTYEMVFCSGGYPAYLAGN